jgi:hypothetical protein
MKPRDSSTDTAFAAHVPHTEPPTWQQQQQQHDGYPLLHKVSSGGASAASQRLQESLQDLQEDERSALDDPWSREAGPEEGMPVLAGALLLLSQVAGPTHQKQARLLAPMLLCA